MKMRNLPDLDLHIARARIFLSLATQSSICVDPNVPDMTPWIRLTGVRCVSTATHWRRRALIWRTARGRTRPQSYRP